MVRRVLIPNLYYSRVVFIFCSWPYRSIRFILLPHDHIKIFFSLSYDWVVTHLLFYCIGQGRCGSLLTWRNYLSLCLSFLNSLTYPRLFLLLQQNRLYFSFLERTVEVSLEALVSNSIVGKLALGRLIKGKTLLEIAKGIV